MTSATLENTDRTAGVLRWLAWGWITLVILLFMIAQIGPADTIVRTGNGIWTAYLWSFFAVFFVVAVVYLVQSRHAAKPLGLGQKIVGGATLTLFAIGLGLIAAKSGATKVSIWISSSPLTIDAKLHGAHNDGISERDRRHPLRRFGWELRHPNNKIYLIGLNSVMDRGLNRQYFASAQTYGLPLFRSKRASMGDPVSAMLSGRGNWFAFRVDTAILVQ